MAIYSSTLDLGVSVIIPRSHLRSDRLDILLICQHMKFNSTANLLYHANGIDKGSFWYEILILISQKPPVLIKSKYTMILRCYAHLGGHQNFFRNFGGLSNFFSPFRGARKFFFQTPKNPLAPHPRLKVKAPLDLSVFLGEVGE